MQTTQIYADNVAIYPRTNYEGDGAAERVRRLEEEKAPLRSPAFTGTPQVPDPPEGSNGSQAANTRFVVALIAKALGSIINVRFETVDKLPEAGEQGVFYLAANEGGSYDEYIWVNGAFEKIGSTDIDLAGYLEKGGGTMTGTLASSVQSGTHAEGFRGRVIIDSTAPAGFTMLSRLKSTNGAFIEGVYDGRYILEYMDDAAIGAGSNATGVVAVLLDEEGNATFPGNVTAKEFRGTANTAFLLNANSGAKDANTAVVDRSLKAEEYTAAGSAHLPSADDYIVLTAGGKTNGSGMQLAVRESDGGIATRGRHGGGWKAWNAFPAAGELRGHISDASIHIKASERSRWDGYGEMLICDFPEVAVRSFMNADAGEAAPKDRAASISDISYGDTVWIREDLSCTDGATQWEYTKGLYRAGRGQMMAGTDGTLYYVVGDDMEKIGNAELTIGQKLFLSIHMPELL